MKAYGKTAVRLFKKHLVRLVTIIAIVVVSIGVMSGIGELESRLKIAVSDYYEQQNISALYVKSKKLAGFSPKELAYFNEKFGEENVLQSFSFETEFDNKITRFYSFDASTTLNALQLLEGELPSAANEILAERACDAYDGKDIGDKITLTVAGMPPKEYTVCGITLNPLLTDNIEETSYLNPEKFVSDVFYIHKSEFAPIVNDVYIRVANKHIFNAFSKDYERKINGLKAEITNALGEESASVLSLFENRGLYAMVSYAEKVGLIGIVFVIFFLLVTMLVVYSNMSRLFDEERGQIACLKTLGYSDFAVIGKYLLFVLFGTVLGGAGALPIGLGLTSLLYTAFNMQYAMPPFPGITGLWYYVTTFGIIIVSMLLLTYFTGMKTARNKPVTLLAHKTPKSGKKVILERIPIIWNRLSFKYKSTLRNVLLFKSRFLMTVISIIGSTVLVLAGLGLIDCSLKLSGTAAIFGIAAALVAFSAVLCGLVIYNLTNINVSERNREIATLMVLGYSDSEVSWYIFREIHIMSFIGAVLGVPIGLAFLTFVFHLINFGSIGEINWWTWILAPAVTMLFSVLSTLLLRRKIVKTDMNSSLKILE